VDNDTSACQFTVTREGTNLFKVVLGPSGTPDLFPRCLHLSASVAANTVTAGTAAITSGAGPYTADNASALPALVVAHIKGSSGALMSSSNSTFYVQLLNGNGDALANINGTSVVSFFAVMQGDAYRA
jgi:hypothetical protein